jgi:hypothetical protein
MESPAPTPRIEPSSIPSIESVEMVKVQASMDDVGMDEPGGGDRSE